MSDHIPNIPGPPTAPLIGPDLNGMKMMVNPFNYLMSLKQQYGDIVSLGGSPPKYVAVFSPELIKNIMNQPEVFYNSDAEHGQVTVKPGTAFYDIFSGGLNQMNGHRHKQQRRLMRPAFHKQSINTYRDQIVSIIDQHLASWKVGDQRDLLHDMRSLTAAVALKLLMGLDLDKDGKDMLSLLERWVALMLNPVSLAMPLNIPGSPYAKLLNLSVVFQQRAQELINTKRQNIGSDVLSTLIQAHDEEGETLSDAELIGQTLTLFVAGHETTASALTWTILLLTQYPQVYEKLIREINQLNGKLPQLEDLESLPYLENVIKESMRLLPPFIFQLRHVTQDTVLGGYPLKAGTSLTFSSIVTHRDPQLYPNPNQFAPDRWQDFSPQFYEYFPFSGGPRRCLGAEFAMLEIKLALVAMLQRFSFEVTPQAKVDRGGMILSAPKGGLPIHLTAPRTTPTNKIASGTITQYIDLNS